MTTRETILSELKSRGPSRADDLAKPLNLTAMAVRQHLYMLQEEGAVEALSVAEGRGRPAKKWQLTKKADVYFPDAHRDLSLDIIDSIRAVFGEEAMDQLIDHRCDKQYSAYKSQIPHGDIKARLKAIAKLRTNEGYMAESVEEDDGTYMLLENHCPICEAARACSGLCKKELDLFKSLLPDASVERTDHILNGARRCAYRVVPKA